MLRKTDNACLQFVIYESLIWRWKNRPDSAVHNTVRLALLACHGQLHCTHPTAFGKPFNTVLPVRVIGQSGKQIKDCIPRW